jgi:hypothetical protein
MGYFLASSRRYPLPPPPFIKYSVHNLNFPTPSSRGRAHFYIIISQREKFEIINFGFDVFMGNWCNMHCKMKENKHKRITSVKFFSRKLGKIFERIG